MFHFKIPTMTIRTPFMLASLVIALTTLAPQNAEAQLFKKKKKTEPKGLEKFYDEDSADN